MYSSRQSFLLYSVKVPKTSLCICHKGEGKIAHLGLDFQENRTQNCLCETEAYLHAL